MLAAGTLALVGCQESTEDATAPRSAATVHVDPTASTVDSLYTLAADDAYAPFLEWKSADTLEVTTFGSSTVDCFPRVMERSLDPDAAYRVTISTEEGSRTCTEDLAPQTWELPVPDGLGAQGVIRVQFPDDPLAVYEYPMGASRPR
ncbi:hypothetical protein GCM10009670_03640 [Citricoccus alkalitolerans]